MYQPMLYLHWKQIRLGLIPFVLAAFALPLLSVQGLGSGAGLQMMNAAAYRAALDFNPWLPLFPILAAATGFTLALSSWNWDHQLKHVYALSLPIPRWRYALLKMGAGAGLALVPTAAFLLGCVAATSAVDLPLGLAAYPLALTLRFLLATLLAYAVLFAMAAGTVRTTGIIVAILVALLVMNGPLTSFVASLDPSLQRMDVVEWLLLSFIEAPGPFEVFTGKWSLIDV